MRAAKLWFVPVFLLASVCAFAAPPVTVDVCQIVKNPKKFDGKVVRVRASVERVGGMFALVHAGEECGGIWLSYPGSPTASSDPAPKTPVKLVKNQSYATFEKLLAQRMYPRRPEIHCDDCYRYSVTAVFEGKVEFGGDKGGFGPHQICKSRLLMMSVSGVKSRDLVANYGAEDFSTEPVKLNQ